MKARQSIKSKPKKSVSSIKHANKKYSKMQKQGKIRKINKKKREPVENDDAKKVNLDRARDEENKIDIELESETDVLDMIEQEDIQFLNKSSTKYDFISQSLESKAGGKKSKLLRPDDDEEMDFEKVPRSSNNAIKKKSRPLLPLKGKDGIIFQSEEVEGSDESDFSDDKILETNGEEAKASLKVEHTAAELYAIRQKKLHNLKLKVASLSNIIIEDPENSARSLKDLRLLLDDSNIGLVGYRLVLISLREVFKDIIPGYQIIADAEDENKRMKKETKTLHDYEEALLRHYKNYLKKLENLISGLKSKIQRSNASNAMKKSSLALGETAVDCLCELLAAHPHFNYHKVIISLIAPLLTHENNGIAERCCSAVKNVFKNDKLGQVSLEIVKHITKEVKAKNFEVKPQVMETFLSLKLKDANFNLEDKKENILTRKEYFKKFSRRERKFKKKMASLDKELLEAEAEESKQKKSKLHTETVKLVFLCYFRVLKQESVSECLSIVLEGLAKFAHLINVDFFDDLIRVLFRHVESGELTYRQSLHCTKAVFTILSGQGQILNIDPQKFYSHLYDSCLDLSAGLSSGDVIILLECVNMMIIQRRKKVSLPRILAFMKRLSSISLQLQHNGILGCLSYVRTLLMTHRPSDILLDPDCSSGSGYFQPELPDPDHCNAQSTSLWELHFLNKHYHPDVRSFAQNILKGAPVQGVGHLAIELSKLNPIELFKDYDPSNMTFKPAIPVKALQLKKSKYQNFGQVELGGLEMVDYKK